MKNLQINKFHNYMSHKIGFNLQNYIFISKLDFVILFILDKNFARKCLFEHLKQKQGLFFAHKANIFFCVFFLNILYLKLFKKTTLIRKLVFLIFNVCNSITLNFSLNKKHKQLKK